LLIKPRVYSMQRHPVQSSGLMNDPMSSVRRSETNGPADDQQLPRLLCQGEDALERAPAVRRANEEALRWLLRKPDKPGEPHEPS
jgi:hypothetical protein